LSKNAFAVKDKCDNGDDDDCVKCIKKQMEGPNEYIVSTCKSKPSTSFDVKYANFSAKMSLFSVLTHIKMCAKSDSAKEVCKEHFGDGKTYL